MEISKEGEVKKRGRRRKEGAKKEINLNQSKYFVDLSHEAESLKLVNDLLAKANDKEGGKVINFKDLVIIAITKLTDKDIERLQEMSLSEMEKVERALIEFNKKNNVNLSMGEFLIKKLGIN